MSKETMRLALEVLKAAYVPADLDEQRERVITAFEAELAKPDFWEGYVPEPVKPAQQLVDCHATGVCVQSGLRAEQPAQQEPVHQFRKRGCSDWYDGHPDHTDGGGPYEARTLYTSPLARHGWTTEQIAGMVRLKESQDKKLSQRKWVGLAEQEALDKKAENARELGLDYEPVCNKDPQGCWNVRCQLGKKCKNTQAQQEYASFAEWAHDYVQDNLHKLKPAQRTWVGLTNDEKHQLNDALNLHGRFPIIDAIESKIKEKNT